MDPKTNMSDARDYILTLISVFRYDQIVIWLVLPDKETHPRSMPRMSSLGECMISQIISLHVLHYQYISRYQQISCNICTILWTYWQGKRIEILIIFVNSYNSSRWQVQVPLYLRAHLLRDFLSWVTMICKSVFYWDRIHRAWATTSIWDKFELHFWEISQEWCYFI